MVRVGWWLMTAMLIGACSTAKPEEPLTLADIATTVVLETYSTNLAWGYELKGMYIDGMGAVWAYEHRGTPWYPEKLRVGELSERDMLTKHQGAKQIGTVDRQQLLEMAQLIAGAARGPIVRGQSPTEGRSQVEVAYQFDREKRVYSEVMLFGSGDQVGSNTSPQAVALRNYLHEVEASVGYR